MMSNNAASKDDEMETDDNEYDEALVYVEFTGIGVGDILNQSKPELKIIGSLEESPIIQIGGHVYSGQLADTFGTHVFFEQIEKTQEFHDAADLSTREPCNSYGYCCKTNKEITVKRIYIKEKEESTSEPKK